MRAFFPLGTDCCSAGKLLIIANTLFIINSLVRVTCGGLIANHSRFVTETLLPIYEELVSDLIKNFCDFIIDGIRLSRMEF